MTQIRRRFTGAHTLQVETRADVDKGWKPVGHLVALDYESPYTAGWEVRHAIGYGGRPGTPVLPFQPLSVRHFYGSDQAILEAAYASLGRLLPPVTNVWETFVSGVRERLPALAQTRQDEIHTAYRLNNPLSVVPTASPISVPSTARGLTYEPRLGFVISKELADATPEDARGAIAAFVLICEFSAHDGPDPRAGSVPVPATPPSSIAEIAVSAKVLLDLWNELDVSIYVNDTLVEETSAAGSTVDLGELLATASVGQRLMPGELFSIDALAPELGTEPLRAGDHLVIDVPRLGLIEHSIS